MSRKCVRIDMAQHLVSPRETLMPSDNLAMGNMSSRWGKNLRAYWGSSDLICINQFHFEMYGIKQSNRSFFFVRVTVM